MTQKSLVIVDDDEIFLKRLGRTMEKKVSTFIWQIALRMAAIF